MGHFRFGTALALATAAVALASCGAGGIGGGGDSALAKAGKDLKAKSLEAKTEADLPALGNAGAALVRGAFDPAAVRGLPLNLDTYSANCGPLTEAYSAYIQSVQRVTAHAADPQAAFEAGLIKLQNEITLGTEATNLCTERGFRTIVGDLTNASADRIAKSGSGAKQMRDGAVQMIGGTVQTALDPGLSADNRGKLFAVLRETAPIVAPSLTVAQRQKLGEQLAATQQGASAGDSAELASLAKLFATNDCNALCKVPDPK